VVKVYIKIGGDRRKGKCYAKLITAVKPGIENGYALEGRFLREGEHDLPPGAVVMIREERGSWKYHKPVATLFQVTTQGLQEVGKYYYDTQFISLRDKILELLEQQPNPLMAYSDEQLIEELIRRGYKVERVS